MTPEDTDTSNTWSSSSDDDRSPHAIAQQANAGPFSSSVIAGFAGNPHPSTRTPLAAQESAPAPVLTSTKKNPDSSLIPSDNPTGLPLPATAEAATRLPISQQMIQGRLSAVNSDIDHSCRSPAVSERSLDPVPRCAGDLPPPALTAVPAGPTADPPVGPDPRNREPGGKGGVLRWPLHTPTLQLIPPPASQSGQLSSTTSFEPSLLWLLPQSSPHQLPEPWPLHRRSAQTLPPPTAPALLPNPHLNDAALVVPISTPDHRLSSRRRNTSPQLTPRDPPNINLLSTNQNNVDQQAEVFPSTFRRSLSPDTDRRRTTGGSYTQQYRRSLSLSPQRRMTSDAAQSRPAVCGHGHAHAPAADNYTGRPDGQQQNGPIYGNSVRESNPAFLERRPPENLTQHLTRRVTGQPPGFPDATRPLTPLALLTATPPRQLTANQPVTRRFTKDQSRRLTDEQSVALHSPAGDAMGPKALAVQLLAAEQRADAVEARAAERLRAVLTQAQQSADAAAAAIGRASAAERRCEELKAVFEHVRIHLGTSQQ